MGKRVICHEFSHFLLLKWNGQYDIVHLEASKIHRKNGDIHETEKGIWFTGMGAD